MKTLTYSDFSLLVPDHLENPLKIRIAKIIEMQGLGEHAFLELLAQAAKEVIDISTLDRLILAYEIGQLSLLQHLPAIATDEKIPLGQADQLALAAHLLEMHYSRAGLLKTSQYRRLNLVDYLVGGLPLDIKVFKRAVYVGRKKVEGLGGSSFHLLLCLSKRLGEAVSGEEIIEHIKSQINPNFPDSTRSNALRNLVYTARQYLRSYARQYYISSLGNAEYSLDRKPKKN